ncbi:MULTISPECIES: helix-turn-helix domain-containing protein [Thermoanaerobacterium]|uniref:XRE family transcriptional regulator n=2 Tax=Thermoanaerobacterium TaxID=28895 RepID=W9E9K6_9THEO|nr:MULTISPECIES: helix-turn-helix domain-containing protein [Thermoanaerobacterium]AFK85868.1 transcriptional regulator, XRE family [Thermoanaerobacterium saccharolyticum JW/SL-YS485]ETO38648.1 XRE family transcriptional regulator [Thermoanaerobacterium aotearoense SCUT27]
MTFSDRLKELRKEKNLTQEDLAKILEISRSTIAGYETERKEPDYETLKKIADFFNVSIDYLLGRIDIRSPLDKITKAVLDDPELLEFWNTLKDREDLKHLFNQTKKLSPKNIRQIIRIIKAIEEEENKGE